MLYSTFWNIWVCVNVTVFHVIFCQINLPPGAPRPLIPDTYHSRPREVPCIHLCIADLDCPRTKSGPPPVSENKSALEYSRASSFNTAVAAAPLQQQGRALGNRACEAHAAQTVCCLLHRGKGPPPLVYIFVSLFLNDWCYHLPNFMGNEAFQLLKTQAGLNSFVSTDSQLRYCFLWSEPDLQLDNIHL